MKSSYFSIGVQILSIVGIFSLALAVYVGAVVYSTESSLEKSDFRYVVDMKDVIADVLPPPMYVIESFLVALELEDEQDPNRSTELRARWRQLEKDYSDRHAYWAERLAPGQLRGALLESSQTSARKLFEIGDQRLMPALDAHDREQAHLAVVAIRAAYTEHRADIDRVVEQANQQTKIGVEDAERTIQARTRWRIVLGVLIAFVGAIAATWIARGITRRVQHMAGVLAEVAEGDLSQRATVDSHDEIGAMALGLNRALEATEGAFLQVRQVTTILADASAHLAQSTEHISSGAQSQAASLEETAASLEQITATVKMSAGNAQQANRVALNSRDIAERGGSVVAEAVTAMDQIRQASRRIGDIITTIDEIALQTNLLALNAAVEAARAGEQGRGFAVVAAEVGNLAQRSAGAAKEVKTLIQDTLHRVEAGHELVGGSGRSYEEIIQSVKKVVDIVGEIAAAAHEQSTGVDQVNQAVSQMDQVTQSNAAQTAALTRTADDLAHSADQLRELLSRFRLGETQASPAAPLRHGPGLHLTKLRNQHRPANDDGSDEIEVA